MLTFNQLTDLTAGSVEKLRLPEEPGLLYQPIRYTLDAGGKRVRPMIALASCSLFTDDIEKALPAAMGIEVFHNFTLLHDDIMDNSLLRRGRDTVHVKWNENIAILSGDAMLIYAYDLIAQSDPSKLAAVLRIFNRMMMDVCEGQIYDMEFETRNNVSIEQYLHMIMLKTSVLLGGAAQIGAMTGGADEDTAKKLYEFGVNLGLGFQLQDDLLDTFGNEQTFGKNIGDDITSNKKTFLLLKALELSTGDSAKRLTELVSTTDFDRDSKIAEVQNIYETSGVRLLTEKLIDDYFAAASSILGKLPVADERKELLYGIIRLLNKRDK